jgi:hypothetical protein
VRSKLVHGSDWPIIALPPLMDLGVRRSWSVMFEPNWMRRDIQIKQHLGFDDAYWRRAAEVLRLPRRAAAAGEAAPAGAVAAPAAAS